MQADQNQNDGFIFLSPTAIASQWSPCSQSLYYSGLQSSLPINTIVYERGFTFIMRNPNATGACNCLIRTLINSNTSTVINRKIERSKKLTRCVIPLPFNVTMINLRSQKTRFNSLTTFLDWLHCSRELYINKLCERDVLWRSLHHCPMTIEYNNKTPWHGMLDYLNWSGLDCQTFANLDRLARPCMYHHFDK